MVIRSTDLPQGVSHPSLPGDHRKRQVHAAETRLLYENATTGIAVTIVIASVVAYALWDLGPHFIVSAWFIFMLLVVGREIRGRAPVSARPASDVESGRWNAAFVVGVAMAAAGWGVGAILLYPSGRPLGEILLVFAVGG